MKKIFCLMIFVLSIACVQAHCTYPLNLNAIERQCRFDLYDSTSSNATNDPRWSSEALTSRANIIMNKIAEQTLCCYNVHYDTPTPGVAEYLKPSDCIIIDRMAYLQTTSTTSYKELTYISRASLSRDKSIMWENYSYSRPDTYYLAGGSYGLVPRPSSDYDFASAVQISYYNFPEKLTSATDIPFDGDYNLYSYHRLIVMGVVAWCKRTEGKLAEAQLLQAYFDKELERMANEVKRNPNNNSYIRIE